jgi:catechol 2,3-dioxygenase-like lactoylglutathione lyase family enzyme
MRLSRVAWLVTGVLAVSSAALQAAEVRRPRILGLSHVALFVRDVEASRAFYKDYLGFGEPFWVDDPDGKLRLTWIKINDRQSIELFPEREAGSDRLNHVALETDDAEAMRAFMASKGIAVPDAVPKGRIGNSNFTVKDPDGHGVEIVQYEPAGWTAREKGKFMPDTRVSTRMAHAGVAVADLDASLAFYRDVLGLTETWRGSRDGQQLSWVNLKVPDGDDYLELMLVDGPVPQERLFTLHHVCLEVADVAKTAATLATRTRPKSSREPQAPKTGINGKRQINLFDPDGTRVEVMEPDTADGKPVPPSTAPPPKPQPRAKE